ncbi:MAG: DUF6465 family protein [Lachnospiraceae bacterium]|nr:DUF6465 family protein [Lachnospiraceae bacterium]
MAEVTKKSTTKTEAKPVAKAAVKETAKPEAKAAVVVETKPVEEKKTVEKKVVAKPAAKKTATKKPAAKTAKKAAPAKTDVAEKSKEIIHLQFGGKSYSHEQLINIAKDVWTYDLKQKPSAFKTVELYVKPEECMAYYVINGNITGKFSI